MSIQLPKDVIFQLSLEYDLPTILKFCQTSKRMNEIICNNNYFWLNKLKKDFEIIGVKNIESKSGKEYKEYYKEIYSWITQYPDENILYDRAISFGRLDLVKIALKRGANINYYSKGRYYPLLRTLIYGHPEIFDYLMEQAVLNDGDVILENVLQIARYLENEHLYHTERVRILNALYNQILPKIYTKIKRKNFWRVFVETLERYQYLLPNIYDEKIKDLRQLAE